MELLERLHIKNPNRVLVLYARDDHPGYVKLIDKNRLLKDNQKEESYKIKFQNRLCEIYIQQTTRSIEQFFDESNDLSFDRSFDKSIDYKKMTYSIDIAIHLIQHNNDINHSIHISIDYEKDEDTDRIVKIAHIKNIAYYLDKTNVGLIVPSDGYLVLQNN